MHPARLAYLAGHNAPKRAVVSAARVEAGGEWHLTLECGHVGRCVSHFDCSKTTEWACSPCGVEFVKTSPFFAAEF